MSVVSWRGLVRRHARRSHRNVDLANHEAQHHPRHATAACARQHHASEVSEACLHCRLELGCLLRLGLPLQGLVNAVVRAAWPRDQPRHLRLQVLCCQRPVEPHMSRIKHGVRTQPVLERALAVLAACPSLRSTAHMHSLPGPKRGESTSAELSPTANARQPRSPSATHTRSRLTMKSTKDRSQSGQNSCSSQREPPQNAAQPSTSHRAHPSAQLPTQDKPSSKVSLALLPSRLTSEVAARERKHGKPRSRLRRHHEASGQFALRVHACVWCYCLTIASAPCTCAGRRCRARGPSLHDSGKFQRPAAPHQHCVCCCSSAVILVVDNFSVDNARKHCPALAETSASGATHEIWQPGLCFGQIVWSLVSQLTPGIGRGRTRLARPGESAAVVVGQSRPGSSERERERARERRDSV